MCLMLATLKEVRVALPHYKYYFKTDVKSYYATMRHHVILDTLSQLGLSQKWLKVTQALIGYTITYGGLYKDNKVGMAQGTSAASMIGALYLKDLDDFNCMINSSV